MDPNIERTNLSASHAKLSIQNSAAKLSLLMSQPFIPGDNLIFQLESGYGLFRVLAVDGDGAAAVWHLLTYEELFPDIESAEEALSAPDMLHVGYAHLALTDRAFERTPAARLGHHPITDLELEAYQLWRTSAEPRVSDRSLLQLLGMR